MSASVIVEGISKQYRLGAGGGYRRLTEVLTDQFRSSATRSQPEEFWALKDISFDVAEGEVIGIIGRNGAGKSTLLKILSRITEPTSGRAILEGRVGSLLEVGTGFHPELTGRENIFLNGAVIGMRKDEIARRFDEIVAFAEIDRFLDTPVKRYSSGMYVRLAFAVAAHLEPEILVIDEVLAVGDTAFQKKCLGKMGDVAKSGRTVLFVSHSMAAVRSLCSRAVLLERGALIESGAVEHVLATYSAAIENLQEVDLRDRSDRDGDGRVRVVSFTGGTGPDSGGLVCGLRGVLQLEIEARDAVRDLRVALSITNDREETILQLDSSLTADQLAVEAGRNHVQCILDPLPLMPGRYVMNVYVEAAGVLADWVQEAMVIEVDEGDYYRTGRLPPRGYGSVLAPFRWEISTGSDDQSPSR